MVFAHDTEVSLQAAVTLANSALAPDTLRTIEDLDEFYKQYEYTGRRDHTQAELDAVREMRPRLRQLLTAEREEAVEIVNEMLADARAVPQLVRHGEWDWHVHAVDPKSPLPTRICVETAMSMIDVIRTDEMSRLGVCADGDCEGIVLDLSRNR